MYLLFKVTVHFSYLNFLFNVITKTYFLNSWVGDHHYLYKGLFKYHVTLYIGNLGTFCLEPSNFWCPCGICIRGRWWVFESIDWHDDAEFKILNKSLDQLVFLTTFFHSWRVRLLWFDHLPNPAAEQRPKPGPPTALLLTRGAACDILTGRLD